MPFVILGSSIVTEDGVYNKHNRRFTPFNDTVEIPDGYIPAIVAIEAARNSAVEQIVRLNYFNAIREFFE
jgi:hypothetical protein